ncbi:hypothetical protein EI94DRAFT_1769192 [Lactarius quietus]|nr:hypothetical protein EI94DRAFT_1769192 [Lactarius quietus]
MVTVDTQSVKVYTVNGAAAGSASSLPDWLVRKRAAKAKGKRAIRERVEGTIELIQHFEFPEASNRIKTTRDGHHVIATGTYKPQMRVWDLDQLALKFERHADVENVDFIVNPSDDWTKTLHLQADRTIELHTQGGFHYRTRIPRFGRALAYHFPSCDALLGARETSSVAGVNAIDVNSVHGLWAFGIDGNGTIEFWDPRSRSSLGVLALPRSQLVPVGMVGKTVLPGVEGDGSPALSVTALASRSDGLSYAVGTSTGHTLLYDIRSRRHFALKDQGYGLPVKRVSWVEGGAKMAGDGLVISADKKVIKIWDRNSPSENFTSLTPATDLNDVHHIPGSGLVMTANEGIQMTTYYIPQLGPAPRWCSFLENITEELEDTAGGGQTVYEDYKFVSRVELSTLGLDHLVGTPALKPYMHGYFLSLKLYDAARVIANPYVYEEHRAKMVQEKLDKLAEGRIRARKDQNKVKIAREEEQEKKREERKRKKTTEDNTVAMDVDEEEPATTHKTNLLSDSRFAALFEDPDFQVDEESREYALLNPSAAAQKRGRAEVKGNGWGKGKTAVEEEDEESDKMSSDDESENESEEDSSEAGGCSTTCHSDLVLPRKPTNPSSSSRRSTNASMRLIPLQARPPSTASDRVASRDASFGHRRSASSQHRPKETDSGDGSVGVSWVPTPRSKSDARAENDEDMDRSGKPRKVALPKGVERFGAGMEKGGGDRSARELSEQERSGRKHRRRGMRSGSKNAFRQS